MSHPWQVRLETWIASPYSGPILLLVTFVCYLGALNAGFVWDDTGLVLQNSQTLTGSGVPAIFAGDLWDGAPVEEGTSGYYRPLMVLSLWCDYQLWGHSALGHHLHSLAWHLLAVGLLLKLLRMVIGSALAWPAAAVFALHGSQSEVVIWISARNDSMAVSLGIAALLFSLQDRSRVMSAVWAGVFTVLAGLAKESVLLLPLCLWVLQEMSGERRGLKSYVPILVGITLIVALRGFVGVGMSAGVSAYGWSLLATNLHHVAGLIGQLLWVPWPLSAGYALEWMDRIPPWRVWGGLVLLLAWTLMCLRARGESGRLARWGLAWWGICLLPVLPALASKGLFGDRYLYLAMVGFSVSLASLLHRRVWLLFPLLLGWIVSIQVRIPDWKDDISLWTSTIRAHPSPYSHGGLGNALRSDGQPEAALSHFILAIDDPLPNREVCPQLVGTALVLGDPWGALQLGAVAEEEKGCGKGPRAAVFHANLALASGWTGQVDEAVNRLSKVRELGSPSPELCSRVVIALKQSGQIAGVARNQESLRETGCMEAEDAGQFAGEIASSLVLVGQWEKAIQFLESAPVDPSGQDQVVRGAWAMRQGDQVGYSQIREVMDDPARFDLMVQQLLEDASH